MSQSGYQTYPAYEPGAAYFNGSIDAPARTFDARTGTQQSAVKQLEPGMQSILDSSHDARHSISTRPFDTYTYPGYEASFHATSPSIDQSLQVLLNGHRPYASSRETGVTYSNPIANFYNDADGPWNSLRATSQARSSAPTTTGTVPMPNLDYTSYRDAPASEISDSGYASQAAASQSVVNTEPTDYNRECGDLPVQINSFSFTAASSSSTPYDIQSLPNRIADETDATSPPRPKPGQSSLLCPKCGETSKCPSDFKKHQLKHTKPWKCDEPDCSRKDGFTTINDLNRHKKSVHKIGCMTKSFRCVADRCRAKGKLWPRLDNFKQHLTRMHSGEDLEDMIRRSQTYGSLDAAPSGISRAEPVSQMENTLAGIDSKSSDLNLAHPKNSPDFALIQDKNDEVYNGLAPDLKASFPSGYPESRLWDQSQFQSYQDEPIRFQQTPEDHKPGRGNHPDAPKLRELADAATAASHTGGQPSFNNGSKSGAQKSQKSRRPLVKEYPSKGGLTDISNKMALSITKGSANEPLDKAVLRAFLELKKDCNMVTIASDRQGSGVTGNLKNADRPPPGSGGPVGTETTISTVEVLKGIDAVSKDIKDSIRKSSQKVDAGTATTQGFPCGVCGKVMRRQCDLNKHSKRHTRPYGCTFSKCYDSFGSKNDWKRHERSQHYHYEMWRCELSRPVASPCSSSTAATATATNTNPSSTQPAVCAEVFWTTSDFSDHLRATHGCGLQKVNTEIQIRHLHRNGQHRFWCGFCKAIIPLKIKGCKADDERFNHIDKHFKEGLRTSTWLDVETNKYKADMQREEKGEIFEDLSAGSGDELAVGESANGEDRRDGYGPMMRAAEKSGADVVILTARRDRGTKRAREGSEGKEGGGVEIGQPERKRRKEETLFFCCNCKQGPFAWSLYQSCLHCEHEFCERCDRRKHESSAEEESVDYNLWNHVVRVVS